MFLVVIGGANFISVRFYGKSQFHFRLGASFLTFRYAGEVEFWAAIIKVIAVMGCIVRCGLSGRQEARYLLMLEADTRNRH